MTPHRRRYLARKALRLAREYNFHVHWQTRSPDTDVALRHARRHAQLYLRVCDIFLILGYPPPRFGGHQRLLQRRYFQPKLGPIGSFI